MNAIRSVAAPVLGLVALGAACQSTNYPGEFTGPYEAGIQSPSGSGSPNGGTTLPEGGVYPEGGLGDVVVPNDTGAKDVKTTSDVVVTMDAADATKPPCAGCTVLWSSAADPVFTPVSLALDASNVYWTQGQYVGGKPVAGTGSVWSVPRSSTASAGPLSIVYGGDTGPLIVKALPGSTPYITWSSLGASAGMGTVFLQSGGPPLGPGMNLTAPFGVAIDSANVYWVSSAGGGAAVQASGLSAGTAMTLGTATGGFLPQGMALDGTTSIYFVAQLSGGGGGLFQLPYTGGTPTEVWTGDATSQPVDVAVDGTNVYWTDQGDGAVYAMPLAGGKVTTLASKGMSGVSGPVRIAVDSTNVYFSDTAAMAVYEVPTGGGAIKTLVPGSDAIAGIVGLAADGTDSSVYFSSATEILSIAK